jgi:hypothetical protein
MELSRPFVVWIALGFTASGIAACGLATAGVPAESGSTSTSSTGSSSQGGGGSGGATTTTSTSTSTTTTSTTNSTSSGSGGMCTDGACGAIPKGWKLVTAKSFGVTDPLDTCPSSTATAIRYFTDPAASASCSPCTCSQGTCTAPKLQCSFSKSDCTSVAYTVTAASTDTCLNVPSIPGGTNSNGSCKIGGAATVETMCAANGGGELQNDPPWGGAYRVCEITEAMGCKTGELCVPSQPPAGEMVCITQPGMAMCPAGWDGMAISAFTDVDMDTRACSACTCNTTCSGGSYVIHDNNDCQDNTAQPVNVTGACTSVAGLFDFTDGSVSPTAATPTDLCGGGDPTGKVTGKGAQKICCK